MERNYIKAELKGTEVHIEVQGRRDKIHLVWAAMTRNIEKQIGIPIADLYVLAKEIDEGGTPFPLPPGLDE